MGGRVGGCGNLGGARAGRPAPPPLPPSPAPPRIPQAEYEREAIDWSYIEFVDNQDVLDLIEKKPLGILDVLDDVCRFPRAAHTDFADKLYGSPGVKESPRFGVPKRVPHGFTVRHYAGEVTYRTQAFLAKNRDFVVAEHQALMQASGDDFVCALFPPDADAGRGSGDGARPGPGASAYKFQSVGSQFKKQLGELMAALHTMEPHYVRCIKPNARNRPADFEAGGVLHQLRCGGVLEAVRISCAGFPAKARGGRGGGGREEGGVAGAAGAWMDGSCGRPSPCPETPAPPSAPSFS